MNQNSEICKIEQIAQGFWAAQRFSNEWRVGHWHRHPPCFHVREINSSKLGEPGDREGHRAWPVEARRVRRSGRAPGGARRIQASRAIGGRPAGLVESRRARRSGESPGGARRSPAIGGDARRGLSKPGELGDRGGCPAGLFEVRRLRGGGARRSSESPAIGVERRAEPIEAR